MISQKISGKDILYTSIKAGVSAVGICLLLLFPAAGIIMTGSVEEINSPMLTAGCALLGGFLSGILWRIGRRGKAAAVLLSTAMVILFIMILSCAVERRDGQLQIQGIIPMAGAFSAGLGLSCIMQNNKKDTRRKK